MEQVTLQLIAAHLRSLAAAFGVNAHAPGPSQEAWAALFHQLVQKNRFAEALRVAKIHSTFATSSQRMTLVETLLNIDVLPDLVRAEAHDEYGILLRERLQADQSSAQFKLAEELYRKIGHATGPLLIEVRRLTRSIGTQSPGDIVARLFGIKAELEDLGYWGGSLQTVQALYEVAMHEVDDELRRSLDRELLRLKDLKGSSLDWCMQQSVVLTRWSFSGENAGILLASFEALYQTLSTMEAPRLRESVATKLRDHYQQLGDPAKAAEWANEAPDAQPVPWRYLHGKDDFYNQVESPTYKSPLSLEQELEELRAELARTVFLISADEVPMQERYVSVMKISNLANQYVNKHKLLGFERAKVLAETCLAVLPEQFQHLPTAHLPQWESNILQTRAHILSIEACQDGMPNVELLNTALTLRKKAYQILAKGGNIFQASLALQQIGNCYQTLWISERLSGGSQGFEKAVHYYEAAKEGLSKTAATVQDSRKFTVRLLAGLWFQGFEHRVTIYRPRALLRLAHWLLEKTRLSRLFWIPDSLRRFKWPRMLTTIGVRTISPLEETIKYLHQGEALADEQRNDLSALNTKQAIIAKQALRKTDNSTVLYDIGIRINMLSENIEGVWYWLQKAKARSLSDLLGLGINVPEDLAARIDADSKARIALEEEKALLAKIEQDKTDSQFSRRQELEALRKNMHRIECLDELLKLREGQSVSPARLRDLRNVQGSAGDRHTFFADFFIVNGNVCMLAMCDVLDGITFFGLDTTAAQVTEWRKRYMTGDPLSTTDIEPLQELAKLVEPLVRLTEAGDLLVLCATDTLHSIPLHAATISADSDKPLIERNPIVYTSSMTIFAQCVSRAATAVKVEKARSATLCAVYEQPGADGWERERERVYATSCKVAARFDGATFLSGGDVTRAGFQDACQSHVVSFYGHHDFAAPNVMDQGLVLASVEPPVDAANAEASADAPDQPRVFAPDTFTVSDIFAAGVRASHVTLVACASASQAVQPGDEPLGTVTALLCAGASSVLGTLWAIESGSGRAFSDAFHGRLARTAAAEGGGVVDVAVALQQAVRKMRRSDDTEEPFHWASFVLHGSWFYKS